MQPRSGNRAGEEGLLMHSRWTVRIAVLSLVTVILPAIARAQSASVVDWLSIDSGSRTVTGTLDGMPVTLTWSPNGSVPATYFQGNAPWFNSVAFTPPFESTDGMEVVARRAEHGVPSYTITFGSPVTNPVVHLGSLASSFAFVGAMPRKVSGDERFSVSGNAASGIDHNEPNGIDGNGTITFSGTYSSLTFTAAYSGPAQVDGVTIQVGAMPGSRLVGLEVVQVVQDWRNSVPLVAGKKTLVRAHLSRRVDEPDVGLVRTDLWAFDGQGQPLSPPSIRNGPFRTGEILGLPWLVTQSTRNVMSAAVHFYIPDEWLLPGRRTFQLQTTAEFPIGACADQAPPLVDDCAVSVDFVARRPMVVEVLRTQFQDTDSSEQDCATTGGQYVAGICTYMTRSADLTAACDRIRTEMPTHEVDCRIGQNPIILPPAPDRPTADEIIEEVIGRKRDRCIRCDDFYLAVTTFSSIEDYAGMAYLPSEIPDDTHRTAWAMAARREPGAIEHEIGHNFGLQHPSITDTVAGNGVKEGTCSEEADEDHLYPPSDNYFFPYYLADSSGNKPRLGPILPNAMQTLVYGFDTLEGKVVSHLTSSQMSYCGDAGMRSTWSDIGSYGFQFAALDPSAPSRDSTLASNTSEYFWLAGAWNRATDAASFDPVEIATPPMVPPVPVTGILELVIHSSAAPDVVQPLAPNGSPNQPNQFTFHAWVQRSPDITGFSVRRNGVVLAETHISAQAPQIAIISPAPGDTYIGQDITLSWTAVDNDSDPLTFRIEYSIDGGTTWEMLSSNWPTTSFVVNADLLLSTPSARFRVTALDGFLSTTAVMPGTITVINSAIFDSGFE